MSTVNRLMRDFKHAVIGFAAGVTLGYDAGGIVLVACVVAMTVINVGVEYVYPSSQRER